MMNKYSWQSEGWTGQVFDYEDWFYSDERLHPSNWRKKSKAPAIPRVPLSLFS